MMATLFASLWMAETVTRSSLWFGRRSVMQFATGLVALTAGLSLAAHVLEVPSFHALASLAAGSLSAASGLHIVYLSDISTADQVMRNVVASNLLKVSFLVVSMGLNVALSTQIVASYITSVVITGIATMLFFMAGDWSPPKHKRVRPSVLEFLKTIAFGPALACGHSCNQTTFTNMLVWCAVMGGAGGASLFTCLINYLLEQFNYSTAGVSALFVVFTVVSALVLAISKPFVKPPALYYLTFTCFSSVIALVVMALAKDNHAMFLIGLSICLFSTPAGAVFPVVLLAQQPPSRKHEVAGVVNVFGVLFAMLGALIGGAWAAVWLDRKEKGEDFPVPVWASVPWSVACLIFSALSHCFKNEDRRLYGMPIKQEIEEKYGETEHKDGANDEGTQEAGKRDSLASVRGSITLFAVVLANEFQEEEKVQEKRRSQTAAVTQEPEKAKEAQNGDTVFAES